MTQQISRLGDVIDDFCPRCRLLLNHAVASMVEAHVVKVICQTCYTEHPYLHGQGGKKKASPRATLFDQVLAGGGPGGSSAAVPGTKKKGAPPARYISRHKSRPSGRDH